MKMWLFILALFLAPSLGARLALVLSATSPIDNMQMAHAYLRYLYSPKSQDYVSILSGGVVILDWTSVRESAKVTEAIRTIPTYQMSCGEWDTSLRSVALLATQPTIVYLLTNVMPCSTQDAIYASREVQTRGIQVFPVAMGSNVTDQILERVAGPCHPSFGCVKSWHYLHVTS
jgi:hypothetical protein